MQLVYALSEADAVRPPVARGEIPDKALIEAIAGGDTRAMTALFARHSVRVYRFVLRLTKRPALAEDLVNEVFLEVWRGARKFEGRSQVSTWLLAIARFKAFGAMRQLPREDSSDDAMAQIEDPADSPETVLEKTDRFIRLRKCLTRLSPAHREIIDLVYYHEKTVAETSELLGLPQGTVKTRMFFARKRLAEFLQQAETSK